MRQFALLAFNGEMACMDHALLAGICRACSAKMATLEEVERLGLPILDDMPGNAGMTPFIQQGYDIVTFA